MIRRCGSVLLMLGLLSPGVGLAVGLGDLTLESYLNEPLRAEVDLLETADVDAGEVKVRLASREDFERAGVERSYFLTKLNFEIETSESGVNTLLITSSDQVKEPYLDFIVEVRWPTGRLLREYAVLLDPPVYAGAADAGVTAKAVAPTARNQARQAEQQRRTERAEAESEQAIRAQREYGANAVEPPTAGAEYMVQRNDTMWRIASRSRPPGSSVQQAMLDIQRLNPEAFIGGNINRLKAGYVLRLPTQSDLSGLGFEEAVAQVAEQEQNWQDGVYTRIDASEGRDGSGVAGADGEEGHLQISGVGEDAAPAMSGDVSARMEDLDRVQRENADLSVRLGSVEQQMDMQQRLIDLKDDQIAALQEALTEAGGSLDTQAISEQEGAVEALVESMPEAETVTAAEQTEPEAANDAANDAANNAEPAPTPAPAPRPAPAPGIFDMLMDYLLYVVAGLVIIVLAVLYLLRGKLNMPLRRGDQPLPARGTSDDEDEFADVELVNSDELVVDEFDEDAEEDSEVTEPMSNFSSAPDEDAYAAQFETGDALAEADIYIAYGRFPQAVDLLKTAIGVEPLNTGYRMKLMEACVEMVESAEFQQQYADLQVIGDETVLQRARSLLDAVDGGEVWLNDLPEASISATDVAAATASADSDSDAPSLGEFGSVDLGIDDETDEGLDLSLDDDTSAGLDLDDESLDQLTAHSGGLDLELELESDSALDSALDSSLDASVDGATDTGGTLEMESLDTDSLDTDNLELDSLEMDSGLDVDFGGDSLELESDELETDTLETTDLALETNDLELENLDGASTGGLELDSSGLDDGGELDGFDMDSFESTADPAEESLDDISLPELELDDLNLGDEEPAAVSESDSDDMLNDFGELEIEGAEPAAEPDSELGDLTDAMSLDTDLAADDLEIELGVAAGPDDDELNLDSASGLDSLELHGLSDEGDDEEGEGLVFAADGDEIATKMDLARAYIDMGDHDGARSILEEVQEDGSDAQKQEAQTLLDGID